MAKKGENKTLRETAKHREAFLAWYEEGRHYSQTKAKLKVSDPTLTRWIAEFNWHERADKLDEKAQAKIDAKLINERVKRLAKMNENHFQIGNGLLKRSSEYLQNNEFKNANEAIAGAKAAVEIQRKAEGLPDWLLEITEMNEDELQRERDKLLRELANAGNQVESD
jgi:hypothetical protein